MSTQLDAWRGDFGVAYTQRNQPDWRTRVEGFRRLIPGDVTSVLEVGCNRGHNLLALRALGIDVRGVEPQDFARGIAENDGLDVHDGTVYDTRCTNNSFDLVLVSGVLTHVPPERLDEAFTELFRVAPLVLAIEYGGNGEHVPYRGHDNLLWRHDIAAHGHVTDSGKLGPEFDDSDWWLMSERSG